MNSEILSILPIVLTLLGLLLVSCLLVATEISLIKLRFSHFDAAFIEKLRAKKSIAPFFEKGDMIKVIRFGLLGSILGSGITTILIVSALYGLKGEGQIQPLYLSILAFFIILGVFYVFGELVPRGLGLRYPVTVLEIASLPVLLASIVLAPVIKLLEWLSGRILWCFRANTGESLESLDIEAQIEQLGVGELDSNLVVEKLLRNSLLLRQLVVSDVLLPRHQVRIFDLEKSVSENLDIARRTGHTRFPLCESDLDQCIGLIHIKDLFRYPGDVLQVNLRQMKREILHLSPEESLEKALQKLLGNKMHMALVVNEFRGAEGILTLERILEQLVGDIQDEFDAEEANIRMLPNNEYIVLGLTPTHEMEEAFDIRFDNQEVSTFGGLITSELGRIPLKGESLFLQGLEVVITQVDEKRIIKTRVRLIGSVGVDDKSI